MWIFISKLNEMKQYVEMHTSRPKTYSIYQCIFCSVACSATCTRSKWTQFIFTYIFSAQHISWHLCVFNVTVEKDLHFHWIASDQTRNVIRLKYSCFMFNSKRNMRWKNRGQKTTGIDLILIVESSFTSWDECCRHAEYLALFVLTSMLEDKHTEIVLKLPESMVSFISCLMNVMNL